MVTKDPGMRERRLPVLLAWPPVRRDQWRFVMPESKTIERARRDKREGKAPTTQAGEFVREEIEHIREGKHGARSAAQAIAIGLSKARRAGVELPPPDKGEASEETRRSATERSAAARKAARTKGPAERSEAAQKAARTRARHKAGE
jgi:hypothetical protein